jgi:hypothetical protein
VARVVLAGNNECTGGGDLRLSIVATLFANLFEVLLEHGLGHGGGRPAT